ncbi:hypothetical protein Tco_1574398 [Tanacetum coccineum]
MHEDFKYVESLNKEIDELESDKADFSNIYDLLLQECLSKDVMCSYLHSLSDLDAHTELQYLYMNNVKEREYLKAQLQDKNIVISKFKKLIEKSKGKSMETKFDAPSVVRQPNAQRITKPSALGKLAPFSKTESDSKTNVSKGTSKPVTAQILPKILLQTSRNANHRVSTSTRVNHNTSVSRPQIKSTQVKDKVMQNNSQVKFKKTEVEDHHRISSISNKTKFVTACNDSLKSKTSNV